MKKIIISLFILSGVFITSCSPLKEISFSNVESVKLNNLSQKGIEASVTVRIKNPNKMSFKVYRSEMEITVNGMKLGKASITDNVTIKRNSEAPYTFKIKSDFSGFNFADLPKLLSIATSKNLQVNLKGNLKGGKLLMKRSYPIDITQSVPLSFAK